MEDAFTYLDTLGNRLMDLGLAQEHIEMLRDALMKRKNDIHSPQQFVEALGQMLSMVAYGMPEAMDPEEAMWMGVKNHFAPLKQQIEEQFTDMSGANLQGVVDMFMNYISGEMQGSPPGTLEDIRTSISEATNFDELWEFFKNAYMRMVKTA